MNLLKTTFQEWMNDQAPRMAAALAYFALFSIAPLLVIAIAVAGFFFGEAATRGEVVHTIRDVTGPEAARTIEQMIAGAREQAAHGIAGFVGGLVALFFGASGLFLHFKKILNDTWGVEETREGVKGAILRKLWSFGMVLGIGFLLLVSMLLSTVLSAAGAYFQDLLPFGEWFWHVINIVVSLGVITLLFAAMFKLIPDAEIEWRDVWGGAAFTAFLFVIGKFAIGLYLGKSSAASSYGAAASIIIILLWLYYSSLILLFGAEFTEVWARRRQGIATRGERRKREAERP